MLDVNSATPIEGIEYRRITPLRMALEHLRGSQVRPMDVVSCARVFERYLSGQDDTGGEADAPEYHHSPELEKKLAESANPIEVPAVKAAAAKAKAAPAKAAAEVKEITVQELMKLSGEFASLHGAEGRAKLIAILKGYNAEMTSKLEKKDYPKFKTQLESLIEAKKAEQTEA